MITENKIFSYALIASLLIHIFIFWNLAYNNFRFIQKQSPKTIKVSYARSPALKKIVQTSAPAPGVKIDLARQTKAAKEEQRNISPFLKNIPKKTTDFIRLTEKPKVLDEKKIKRKVTVPALEATEIKNPLYLSYYQIVRNRIRDRATANYTGYGRLDAGEVYMTFMLDSKGALKTINITEERTHANQHLRQISLDSVRESSPFPPFPLELNYPELSFNAIISYKIE